MLCNPASGGNCLGMASREFKNAVKGLLHWAGRRVRVKRPHDRYFGRVECRQRLRMENWADTTFKLRPKLRPHVFCTVFQNTNNPDSVFFES